VKLNFQKRSALKIVFERITIAKRIGINELILRCSASNKKMNLKR